METRKVLIVESGGQRKTTIETGAETLAELKQDLDRAGIDYTDKTFFEGLSKTELRHDESLLPRDIPRNGSTTNNLVFMLTTAQKKIKSGAMNRQEAYAKIKELGLQGACMEEFGKNFTLCKTDDLIMLIEKNTVSKPVEEEKPVVKEPVNQCESTDNTHTVGNTALFKKAIKKLVNILVDNDYLNYDERDTVLDCLEEAQETEEEHNLYSDDELEEMFRDL